MKSGFKQIWLEEKKRFILSGILLVIGLLLGIVLGNQVHIDPKVYYHPEHIEWHTIALNNIGAGFIIALSGLLLSIPTVIFLLFNGIMIGFISVLASAVLPLETILAGLLPHGILEIPALLIAGTIGLKPLVWIARFIKLKESVNWKKEGARIALLFSIMIVLLLAASLVEAYVSPYFMDWTR